MIKGQTGNSQVEWKSNYSFLNTHNNQKQNQQDS